MHKSHLFGVCIPSWDKQHIYLFSFLNNPLILLGYIYAAHKINKLMRIMVLDSLVGVFSISQCMRCWPKYEHPYNQQPTVLLWCVWEKQNCVKCLFCTCRKLGTIAWKRMYTLLSVYLWLYLLYKHTCPADTDGGGVCRFDNPIEPSTFPSTIAN